MVYLLFRVFREELQGGFLEFVNLFFEQFSVRFRDDFSGTNRYKSFEKTFKAILNHFKEPNKPVSERQGPWWGSGWSFVSLLTVPLAQSERLWGRVALLPRLSSLRAVGMPNRL